MSKLVICFFFLCLGKYVLRLYLNLRTSHGSVGLSRTGIKTLSEHLAIETVAGTRGGEEQATSRPPFRTRGFYLYNIGYIRTLYYLPLPMKRYENSDSPFLWKLDISATEHNNYILKSCFSLNELLRSYITINFDELEQAKRT